VPRRSRCIRPLPSSTRACGALWHHRWPSVSLRGPGVRATVFRTEMPGFFALAAETPTPRAARIRAVPYRRPLAPCAHRLGERTKRQSLGRVMSCHGLAWQSPDCLTWAATPESRSYRAGLAPERPRLHAPSTDSTSARQEVKLVCLTHAGEGPAAVFRRWRGHVNRKHPCCEEDDGWPRPGQSPRPSLDVAPS
jgi:hypothetical protein